MPDDPLVLPPDEFEFVKARFHEAMKNPGPLIVLPSEPWRERAEAAEARLAAVRDLLRAEHGSWIRMAGIWDAIGDEEGGSDD